MSKNLVIYFSHKGENYFGGALKQIEKGNTEVVAEQIANAVGADVFEVEAQKTYPNGYYACCDEAKKELQQNARPELKKQIDSIEKYDNIFVGYPIWWGTLPMPLFAQLEKLDFAGKNVAPFCTHEGSGLGDSERDIKKLCAGATIQNGLAVRGSTVFSSQDKVAKWAKSALR